MLEGVDEISYFNGPNTVEQMLINAVVQYSMYTEFLAILTLFPHIKSHTQFIISFIPVFISGLRRILEKTHAQSFHKAEASPQATERKCHKRPKNQKKL